jgi:hypothetical protein
MTQRQPHGVSKKISLRQLKNRILNYDKEVKDYKKLYNIYVDNSDNHYRYIHRMPYIDSQNNEEFHCQIIRRDYLSEYKDLEHNNLGYLGDTYIRVNLYVNTDNILPDHLNYIANNSSNFELYFYQLGSIKKELKKELRRRKQRYWINYVLNKKLGFCIEL